MEQDQLAVRSAAAAVARRSSAANRERGSAALHTQVGNAAFGRILRAGGLASDGGSHGAETAVLRSALRSQGAGPLDPEIGAAIEARRGAGSPLPEPVRAEMEGHLGADLSAVRIHTDGAAATLNRAVQAEAFTTGSDVFFSPGRYDPASPTGRGLLAHELTHVVQQTSGAGGPGGTVSHPDDPAEREAAAVGAQVAREAAPLPEEEEPAEGM
ncbi:protein of unknown function (DUF4157) [Parafrankia irregularis]|uniref:eCIS core domain-containing protein n=1 Tax=Parafrankia irregularis TaxID=795642 RepID=A0A0S4QX07_9ACTN|nr:MULTISPECIES: DUF4157 domain-containing protein [Parafrankia]MBE3202504.1 DUF4157 domain-containing protein [Parafrankia sp. CH37]CUU59570.1 protein of unknown function (DUF4157) [Parafrankia irregularis]